MRMAMGIRDGGCATVGCDRPPAMCPTTTNPGQPAATNLATCRLLCPRPHTLAHDPRYQHQPAPSGKITFTRRT